MTPVSVSSSFQEAFSGLLPPGPRLDDRIAHFEAFRARGNALFDLAAGCT